MTAFAPHPAGTDDLVKRLRDYEEYEQSRDGQIICVKSYIALEAADRIEQLEAENKRLGDLYDDTCYYHTPDGRAQFHARKISALEAALTRANAATAAAYEVAANVDVLHVDEDGNRTTRKLRFLERNCVRALATPDQTAALDKLIAEAVGPYVEAMRYYETQFCEGFCEDMPDLSVTNEGMENDCSGCKARAILAASKKGGA